MYFQSLRWYRLTCSLVKYLFILLKEVSKLICTHTWTLGLIVTGCKKGLTDEKLAEILEQGDFGDDDEEFSTETQVSNSRSDTSDYDEIVENLFEQKLTLVTPVRVMK